ncbi:divergent polysaccharide deacetylase family protein [Elioraea sp.]|uniref:divergent polysaccharide deacetylase family protein n=1 Tax=Elioraea sp. TaxID=2185103 RepID=UPI003F701FB1
MTEHRGGLAPAWRALIAFWLVLLVGGGALVAWLEFAPPEEAGIAAAPAPPPQVSVPPAPDAAPPATAAVADAPPPAASPAAPAERLPGSAVQLGPGGIAEPDPALIELRPDGALPWIAPDGRQPWRVYARRFDDADRRPRIAVLVVGLGVSEGATTTAIERLPGEISLAFSPYGLRLDRQFAAARAAGHEVLIGLPMEPANFPLNDPGPQALLTGLPPPENAARLAWALSRAQGYVGVTNAASAVLRGERVSASAEAMRPVLETQRGRGLLYVEARPGERAPGTVPARAADLVIDERPARAEIEARLAELERLAKERGVALGISGPSPLSLDRLAVWAPQVGTRGLVLAPVSAVVVRRASAARP